MASALVAQTVQTEIKEPVKGETTEVHIIQQKSGNISPRTIISRTYELKNADPYEIKAALEAAVGAVPGRRGPAGVECIKYTDGRAAVIVSAEAYRFEKQKAGMSIDELVTSLDQPGAQSASNEYMLYFPQNVSADEAARMIRRSGLQRANDPYELTGGRDSVRVDRELNAVLIKTDPYNKKRISENLELLDKPEPQALFSYRFYRVSAETYSKLEATYKAWLSGAASSFQSSYFPGITNQSFAGGGSLGVSVTYLDFLASENKIETVLAGQSMISNRKEFLMKRDDSEIPPIDSNGILRTSLNSGFTVKGTPSITAEAVTMPLSVVYNDFKGFDKANNLLMNSYAASFTASTGKDAARIVTVMKSTSASGAAGVSKDAAGYANGDASDFLVFIVELIPLRAKSE